MAQKRDYYEILSVGRNATEDEIKKSVSQARYQISPGQKPRK